MHRVLRFLGLPLGLATCVAGFGFSLQAGAKKPASHKTTVDFNRDVRPILAQHCWQCHGADKAALARTGNMKLDTFEGATADRGGYRAITPGKPDQSRLVKRITASPEMRMPPQDSGIKPLTPTEIETIKTWIADGAEYRAHWAFVAPKMPSIPKVSNPKWAKNDIDRFILSKLDEEGIKPEPEADKATLIRRASLTLTGLPPTPAEVSTFLSDKKPDAYERLVDKLLASPRYGENQARYWLDGVRYADTHGLHIDNERAIYPYRDWVVRAYNEDVPYDKFALWQLAGDLLPKPTIDQMIATGYVRLNPTTNEGGAIEAEFLAKNTMDRVDTTATVFLGVTLQCAKCHDHKYDPFSQKDYYSMYAFFDSTADTPLDGNLKLHEPVMPAPAPEQAARLDSIKSQIESLISGTDIVPAKSWALLQGSRLPVAGAWEVSGPYKAKDFDAAYDTVFAPEPSATEKPVWKPIKFELDKPLKGLVGVDNSSAYLRSTVRVQDATKLDLRLGSDDGIKVWLNGALVHQNKVARALNADDDKVTVNLNAGENELLVKIANGGGEDGAFVGFGGVNDKLIVRAHELAGKPSTPEANREVIQTYLALGPDSPEARKYRALQVDLKVTNSYVPMTYIAKELPMARPTYLLKRGQYDMPGEQVSRAIPKVFGSIPPDAPQNRLGLAKWIIDPKNPLTARVMVNKIWQQHFGTGLVKSAEDFGSRGDWPSNPELLDYLACKFVQDGWSIKKLTKMIVTSATYRQDSMATAAKRAKDPENVWLSRGPRFRLDAEIIRDSALYCGGLLDEKMGGHADKPYQPPGLWEIIAYPISDTAKYVQDHGQALYRRSLYMFWKRTSPPPTMLLFDAPMRESCVVRRSKTNTPTQALATLNETGFFEDARAMAQRVIKTKNGDNARIAYAFRLATAREPKPDEISVIKSFLIQQRSRYAADPKEAEATLKIGESKRDTSIPAPEHAAWTLVCNMILNLDETLTLH